MKLLGASAKARKSTMSIRVYRAKTGKWEDYGIVASSSKWIMFKVKIKRIFKKLWR